MPENVSIPDDQMDLLAKAFDVAWRASGAWNRNMTWEPVWEEFLEEHHLTACYKDWNERHPPKGPPEPSETMDGDKTCSDCDHRNGVTGSCLQRFVVENATEGTLAFWVPPTGTPACDLFKPKEVDFTEGSTETQENTDG